MAILQRNLKERIHLPALENRQPLHKPKVNLILETIIQLEKFKYVSIICSSNFFDICFDITPNDGVRRHTTGVHRQRTARARLVFAYKYIICSRRSSLLFTPFFIWAGPIVWWRTVSAHSLAGCPGRPPSPCSQAGKQPRLPRCV